MSETYIKEMQQENMLQAQKIFSTVKAYIRYLWKKTYKAVLIALLVYVLLYPVVMLVGGDQTLFQFSYSLFNPETGEFDWINTNYFYTSSFDTFLYMPTILAMASSYLIPIAVQAQFQNKKRCDNLLSLPIKKQTQVLLTSAYGFIMLLIVFWITGLMGLGTSYIVSNGYNVVPFLLYLLVMSVLSFAVYGITTLFVSLANNTLDSILLLAISLIIPILIMAKLDGNSKILLYICPIYAADEYTCFFEESVGYCTEGFKEFLQALKQETATLPYEYRPYIHIYEYTFGKQEFISLFILLGCGIASYLTSLSLWKNMKSEDMQTPSKKWYSYPLVFSTAFWLFFFWIDEAIDFGLEAILLHAISIVAYFVGMFVFQRKIKFTKTNLIGFVITYVSPILVNVLIFIFSVISFTI